jgi:TPR repeat protein
MQAAGARIPTEEIAALLARGDVLFGKGDITSARLFYERAAEEGDAQAAMRLGESYDAAFLARARLNGVSGDAASALRWYRYARELEAVKGEILLTGVAVDDEVAKRSKEMNQLFEQFLALSKQRR